MLQTRNLVQKPVKNKVSCFFRFQNNVFSISAFIHDKSTAAVYWPTWPTLINFMIVSISWGFFALTNDIKSQIYGELHLSDATVGSKKLNCSFFHIVFGRSRWRLIKITVDRQAVPPQVHLERSLGWIWGWTSCFFCVDSICFLLETSCN